MLENSAACSSAKVVDSGLLQGVDSREFRRLIAPVMFVGEQVASYPGNRAARSTCATGAVANQMRID